MDTPTVQQEQQHDVIVNDIIYQSNNYSAPVMDMIWGLSNETPTVLYDVDDRRTIEVISWIMRHCYAPILIIFGCCGNATVVSTAMNTKLAKVPLMHFVIGIALVDTLFLVSLVFVWIGRLSVTIMTLKGWCQFVYFLSNITTFMSLWLHVAMISERYLTVCRDRVVAMSLHCACSDKRTCQLTTPSCLIGCKCTTLRTKSCVISVCIVGVVIYVNMCITVDHFVMGSSAICVPQYHLFPGLHLLNKLDLIFNVLLPYTFILVLVVRTLATLVRRCRTREKSISLGLVERKQLISSQRQQMDLALCACVMCVVFLLLNIPIQIQRVVYLNPSHQAMKTPITLTQYLTSELLHAAFWLQFALNLPILLATMKPFRTSLLDSCKRTLLSRCRHRTLRKQGSASVVTTTVVYTGDDAAHSSVAAAAAAGPSNETSMC